MRNNRTAITPVLLASIFLVAMLAPIAIGASPSAGQISAVEAKLDNTGPAGIDKIQGTWDNYNEVHPLYMRNGNSLSYARGGSATADYSYQDLSSPPGYDEIENVGPITFNYGTMAKETKIFLWYGEVYISASEPVTVTVDLLAGTNTVSSSTINIEGFAASNPDPLLDFFGSAPYQFFKDVGTNGVTIPEGSVLSVRISASEPLASNVQFEYNHGSAQPSKVNFVTDSANLNVWTEKLNGVTTTAFPVASSAPAADRTIVTRVVHAGMTDSNINQYPHQLRVVDDSGAVYFNSGGSTTASQPWTAVRTARAEVSAGISGSGVNLFNWQLVYPADFAGEGRYHIEAYGVGQNWVQRSTVTIGGASIDITPVAFEDTTKVVKLGEPTEFRFAVTNSGVTEDDAVIQVTGAGAGWKTVLSDSLFADMAPGSTQIVTLRVIPAPGAVDGDLKEFTVKAISANNGKVDASNVVVVLTNNNTFGVDVLSETGSIKMSPGETRVVPVVIKNTGNQVDRFLVTGIGAPAGWIARISPNNIELAAKSQNAALVTLTSPADAAEGTSFILDVKAARLADSTARDILSLPVEIFLQYRFEFDVLGGSDGNGKATHIQSSSQATPVTHQLRDEGRDANGQYTVCATTAVILTLNNQCPGGEQVRNDGHFDADVGQDTDYDQSTIFRLVLNNQGDVDDIIRLRPNLIKNSLGWQDLDGCDQGSDNNNAGDGALDGWRFRWWTDDQTPPAFSGLLSTNVVAGYDNNLVPLAAGETKYVYVELGWSIPSPATEACIASGNRVQEVGSGSGERVADPAPGAFMSVEGISENDPGLRNTHYLFAEHKQTGSLVRQSGDNKYADQINNVYLIAGKDEVLSKKVSKTGVSSDLSTTYRMVAVNAGNEMENVRISIPESLNGWQYDLPFDSFDTALMFGNSLQGNPQNQKAADCVLESGRGDGKADVIVECNMGSWEEVSFDVQVTAPSTDAIGTRNSVDVEVASRDSFTSGAVVSDDATIRTTLVGPFNFQLLPVLTAATDQFEITPGGQRLIPFSIDNTGTQRDNFNVDLSKAPAATSGWDSRFSRTSPIVVAGDRAFEGFLLVEAPVTATVGEVQQYQIKVQSLDSPAKTVRLMTLDMEVVAQPTALSLVGDPQESVGLPGTDIPVTVKATRLTGAAATVTITADDSVLPAGWALTSDDEFTVAYDANSTATATFTVQPPANAIDTSRGILGVSATDGSTQTARVQQVIGLTSSNRGLEVEAPDGTEILVVSGDTVETTLILRNKAASTDQVTLSADNLPAGWSVQFDQANVALQPLEEIDVIATIFAPAGLASNVTVPVLIDAQSDLDLNANDELELSLTTGSSELGIAIKEPVPIYMAPAETRTVVFTLNNTGDVRDTVNVSAMVPLAYKELVIVTTSAATAVLEPGKAVDVTATITTPDALAGGVRVPVTLQADSQGPFLANTGSLVANVEILKHVMKDVDGDDVMEYAISRDRDATNGFEEYREAYPTDGTDSSGIDMTTFLSAEGIAAHEVEVTDTNGNTTTEFIFMIDGDDDGRVDHFVDTDGDGLPDVYFDPDSAVVDALEVSKDVNADGIQEYFIDLDGDGLLDAWYDLAMGEFYALIQVDANDDGHMDYVVDLNQNGVADKSEPILYGFNGKVASIYELADVDGDGKEDTVIDDDADGIPDRFVLNGKANGIPIVMRDVTGDNVDDWTFDLDGDGKRESYYDPVAKESGLIDGTSTFMRSLQEYWYIGAIFLVVLGLFITLMIVTRR